MRTLLLTLLVCCLSVSARADGVDLSDLPEEDEPQVVPPHLAFADASDPNPGSGRGQLLAGWLATGLGVAGITEAPLCQFTDYRRFRSDRRCRRVSLAVGIIGLGVGVPWLVFGYQKRKAQKAWKKRHGLSQLRGFDLAFDDGGATFALSVSF